MVRQVKEKKRETEGKEDCTVNDVPRKLPVPGGRRYCKFALFFT